MNFFLRIGAAIFFGGFLVYVLRLVSKGRCFLSILCFDFNVHGGLAL